MPNNITSAIKKLLKVIYGIVIILGLLLIGMIFFMLLSDVLIRFYHFIHPPKIIQMLSCNSDSDCAITKFSNYSCCIACDVFPISKEGLKYQEEWRKENCASKHYALCPTFKCLWPDKKVSCVQNKCVLSEENNTGFQGGQF